MVGVSSCCESVCRVGGNMGDDVIGAGRGATSGSVADSTDSTESLASDLIDSDDGDRASHVTGGDNPDNEQPADSPMLADSLAPSPSSAVARAAEAEIIAARAVWSQAPTLIPLLAALSYGLGRLMVDGFYGQLHTTAEAAGLGYGSILEPAAILTAILVTVGTAIVMMADGIVVSAKWLLERRRVLEFVLLIAIIPVGGAALLFIQAVRIDDILAALVSGFVLPAFRTLLDKFGSAWDRRVGKARATADRSLSGSPTMDRAGVKRTILVVLSLGFLVSLLFGAHELGTYEGRQAATGKPVDITFLGFNVPSISATAVRIEPIVSGPAFEQLASVKCWLQIGSGNASVLLYDPAEKTTLIVPSDQIVVTMEKVASCAIIDHGTS